MVHRGFIPPPVTGPAPDTAAVVSELRIALSARSRELQEALQLAQSHAAERDWDEIEHLRTRLLEISEWVLWLDRRTGDRIDSPPSAHGVDVLSDDG